MRRDENTVQYTDEEARRLMARGESQMDHSRADAMTEEELEASIDYDEEGRFEEWVLVDDALEYAQKRALNEIDDDVVEWFAAKGPDVARRINEVLRNYIKTQETM